MKGSRRFFNALEIAQNNLRGWKLLWVLMLPSLLIAGGVCMAMSQSGHSPSPYWYIVLVPVAIVVSELLTGTLRGIFGRGDP